MHSPARMKQWLGEPVDITPGTIWLFGDKDSQGHGPLSVQRKHRVMEAMMLPVGRCVSVLGPSSISGAQGKVVHIGTSPVMGFSMEKAALFSLVL